MRRAILGSTIGLLLVAGIALAWAQAPAAPAFASKMLVNNDRMQIQRLSVPPGFREPLQVVINGQKTAGRIEPGTTFYVPKNAPHQFLNMGTTPYDVVVVMLK